ncbi:hypothetical protein C6P40_004482, partial [Pichia californica]
MVLQEEFTDARSNEDHIEHGTLVHNKHNDQIHYSENDETNEYSAMTFEGKLELAKTLAHLYISTSKHSNFESALIDYHFDKNEDLMIETIDIEF